jgi:hypothetical protein
MNLLKKSCLLVCLTCLISVITFSNSAGNDNYGFHFGTELGLGAFQISSYKGNNVTNVNNAYYSTKPFIGYRFKNSDFAIVSGFRMNHIYSEFYVQNERYVMHGNVIAVPLLLRWYMFGREDYFIRMFVEAGANYTRDHNLEFLENGAENNGLLINNIGYTFNFGMRFIPPDGFFFFDVYFRGDSDVTGADILINRYLSLNCRMGFVFNR